MCVPTVGFVLTPDRMNVDDRIDRNTFAEYDCDISGLKNVNSRASEPRYQNSLSSVQRRSYVRFARLRYLVKIKLLERRREVLYIHTHTYKKAHFCGTSSSCFRLPVQFSSETQLKLTAGPRCSSCHRDSASWSFSLSFSETPDTAESFLINRITRSIRERAMYFPAFWNRGLELLTNDNPSRKLSRLPVCLMWESSLKVKWEKKKRKKRKERIRKKIRSKIGSPFRVVSCHWSIARRFPLTCQFGARTPGENRPK